MQTSSIPRAFRLSLAFALIATTTHYVGASADPLRELDFQTEQGGSTRVSVNVDCKDFDSEVLKSRIPVLVMFTTTWNGPCRVIRPIVQKIADENQGKVKVCLFDYDIYPDLANKYAVTTLPTFFGFKGGQKTGMIVGATNRDALLKLVGL